MEVTINIIINEKELSLATVPQDPTPIQYNEIPIKRIYYKKGEQWYKRKPIQALKFSRSDKTVKQEPLLEIHY